jgi:hypothetical protein
MARSMLDKKFEKNPLALAQTQLTATDIGLYEVDYDVRLERKISVLSVQHNGVLCAYLTAPIATDNSHSFQPSLTVPKNFPRNSTIKVCVMK